MSKFVFRLAAVLKVATARRDACRVELAEALARFHHVQRQIETIDEELQALMYAHPPDGERIDVDRLLVADRYGAALRESRATCERQRLKWAEDVGERKNALFAADREVRTLENLAEREFSHYQAEAERREQRELDEIGARANTADVLS